MDEHDTVLGVLPLFHALAQMANLLLPFSIGARVVFLETVNTTELLRALAERKVTIFACVPQFFYLIHQRVMTQVAKSNVVVRWLFAGMLAVNGATRRVGLNLGPVLFRRVHAVLGGRMRVMVTGGSRFDPAIGADLFRLGFNILQGYGLTETSGAATLTRPNDPALDTVGQPLRRQPGAHRAARGRRRCRKRRRRRSAHQRPDRHAGLLQSPRRHGGGLARRVVAHGRPRAAGREGRLSITGRKKELIVLSSGKNIYPEEIEAVYRKSAFIKELCVLGLARPGEPAAERLYAVVVPDDQVLREKKIANVGDIIRFEMEGASVNLPHHKRVLGYEIWMDAAAADLDGQDQALRDRATREIRSRGQARSCRPDPGGCGPCVSRAPGARVRFWR